VRWEDPNRDEGSVLIRMAATLGLAAYCLVVALLVAVLVVIGIFWIGLLLD